MAGFVSPEMGALQQDLEAKRADLQQLRQQLQATHAEREAVRGACSAGIGAARAQMVRMQEELAAARRLQADAAAAAEGGGNEGQPDAVVVAGAGAPAAGKAAETEEDKSRRQAQQLLARTLRYELAKWRHQVELMSEERPKQEAEIVRMKAQLALHADLLEATRGAARHAEVDAELAPGLDAAMMLPSHVKALVDPDQAAAAAAAAAGASAADICVEAKAERHIREKTEDKHALLQSKAKKLMGVSAAQQLMVQRMEKQLLKEEGDFEHKASMLAYENRRHTQLKGLLRRRSDKAVLDALFVARGPRKADLAQPGGAEGLAKSESAPQLPQLPPIGGATA